MEVNNLIHQLGSFTPTDTKALQEAQRQLPENVHKAMLELQKVIPESQMKSARLILQDLTVKVLLETDPTKAAEGMKAIKAFMEHSFYGFAPTEQVFTGKEGGPLSVQAPPVRRTPDFDMAKNLFYGIDTANIATWVDFVDNPEKHPEFIYFTSEMKNIFPNGTEEQYREIFVTLMKATVFELENKAELQTLRGQSLAFEGKQQTDDSTAAKELYATTRQTVSHRAANPYYQEVFMALKALDVNNDMYHGWGIDADPRNREASLWTGGKAVMEFASGDFRVLESSRIGKLFDKFEMHPDWKVQYPLWNILSEGFVESDIIRQVKDGVDPVQLTYHLRADDPNSIGRLIELPTALTRCAEEVSGEKKTPAFEIKMVPLISDSEAKGGMRPLCPEINITLDPQNYKRELEKGTKPITMGLDAIIKFSSQLEKLAADNKFLIDRRKEEVSSRARGLWRTAGQAMIQKSAAAMWTETLARARSRYDAS